MHLNLIESCALQVLYLTSLLEMSIIDISRRGAAIKIDIDQEPAFCGLGPSHAAIGINNQVTECETL